MYGVLVGICMFRSKDTPKKPLFLFPRFLPHSLPPFHISLSPPPRFSLPCSLSSLMQLQAEYMQWVKISISSTQSCPFCFFLLPILWVFVSANPVPRKAGVIPFHFAP